MPGRCQDPPLERCRGEHFVRVSENGTRKVQERAAGPNKPKTRSAQRSAAPPATASRPPSPPQLFACQPSRKNGPDFPPACQSSLKNGRRNCACCCTVPTSWSTAQFRACRASIMHTSTLPPKSKGRTPNTERRRAKQMHGCSRSRCSSSSQHHQQMRLQQMHKQQMQQMHKHKQQMQQPQEQQQQAATATQ